MYEIISGYQTRQMVEWRKTNVSRTISVLVLRVIKWLESNHPNNQNAN
jgi:hypothetical protein